MIYEVIGRYKPSIWKCYHIGRGITRITSKLALTPLPVEDSRYEKAPWCDPSLHAHVRKRTLRKPDGAQWHRDGDYGHIPMDHRLVLWSNVCPTQLRDANGKIYQPKPYEIILFNNMDCYHRRPPDAPRNRFIFRQRVL